MLSCVLFGAKNFDAPNIGDVILVKGGMNYYAKGGKLSFNATSIMPYGKGLLYEKFLKLKAKLQDLGYFDETRKRPVPKRVRRIGVVSSPTGAVIRDIIDVTHRRNDTIDIVLYPVKVQGVGADVEISQGIKFFSDYDKVDVIIVARGGGSAEDLEPFNSEIVANATFESKKPVVSAVGHETDFTIIDFVADLRAPTPSAAAELVAWRKDLEVESISKYILSIEKNLKNKFAFIKKDIDIFYEKLDNIASNKIMKQTFVLDKFADKLQEFENVVDKKITVFDKLNLILINNNPEKISKMGYSKVFQDGKVISSVKKLNDGKITISMIDGQIETKI